MPLGESLVNSGVITKEQLEKALEARFCLGWGTFQWRS